MSPAFDGVDWTPLAEFRTTPDTHPDAAAAIESVRAALGRVSAEHLDPAAVSVDADADHRGAWFRFPHAAEPDVEVRLRNGDGWLHLESPLGTYDGGDLDDEDLEGLVVAFLTGSLHRTARRRGGAVVERRWRWPDLAGRPRELRSRAWRSLWRLALPLPESRETHRISFDHVPAVAPEPAGPLPGRAG